MMTREFEKRWRAVIRSPRWQKMRERLLKERGGECERCGKSWPGFNPMLEMHHKTYDRLGHELDEDVELLCKDCHEAADAERAIRGRQKSEHALYNARLDGWATARYGEEWCADYDYIAEEFEEWLEEESLY